VSKRFKDNAAIHDVSFQLRRGEVVSLLGPSGCGKTTTLRCIAGFYAPDSGSIALGARVVAGPGLFVPPEDRRLSMVFQNYVLWPHMTAFDNVAFGLRLRRLGRDDIARRVRSLLEMLGLAGLENRYPHELSGGQQQRVSVARSLVVEPEVLLLDEPFSNLDARLRVDMRTEMRELLRRLGTTGIYVTHDQEEAMVLSDRIFLMHRGRIVQEGQPRELYEEPRSRFAAEFFGFGNFLPGVTESGGGGPRLRLDGVGVAVAAAAGNVAPGQRYLLCVREDRIAVSPAGGGAGDGFPGRVVRRLYVGGSVELAIACAGDVRIHARVPGSQALSWPEEVAVAIDPAGAVLLRDDGDAAEGLREAAQ